MLNFKDYIKESQNLECGIKYGQILFGDLLGLDEKDTELEKDLTKHLLDYINHNFRDTKFTQLMQDLQKCKTYFKKELVPNAKGTMYRGLVSEGDGTHITKSGLKIREIENGKLYEITGFYDYYIESDRGVRSIWLGTKGTYEPQKHVESWTDNLDSSFFRSVVGENVDIIWEVPLKKNEFVFNSEFLEEVRKNSPRRNIKYIGEDEVLRVSDKPIKGTKWVKMSEYYSWWDFPSEFTYAMGYKDSTEGGHLEFNCYMQNKKLMVAVNE